MYVSNTAEVAEVYLAAAKAGRPPTKAVKEHFGCSRATAGRWVMEARQAGAIPPTRPGSSPRQNRRVVAVARAVGVEPEALEQAIREHANGTVRLF